MARKTCPCGHTRGHPLVEEEPEYTLWGWILLSIFGVTPKPDHIVYRCTICHKSLGVTRDPEALARRGAVPKDLIKAEAKEAAPEAKEAPKP
jgi:hypothetical protein